MINRIFFYWNNGISKAPELVRICIDSWRTQNPGYEIVVLDDNTVHHWVDLGDARARNPRISVTMISDILRWKLLALHGGIWADATLFCTQPLDSWLSANNIKGGFFAFKTAEPHLYNNWFLVGDPSSPIVLAMDSELHRSFIKYGGCRDYWELRGLWRPFHFLEKKLGSFNQVFWSSYFMRRWLKATPYFFTMYLMGAAISRVPAALEDFKSLTYEYGDAFHDLQALSSRMDEIELNDVKKILDGPAPVQKLTNKHLQKSGHFAAFFII